MKHGFAFASRFALVAVFALAAGACGDDSPSLAGDGGSGGDGGVIPPATFTDFVTDLVKNHSGDATPTPFAMFMSLPDADGDSNNVHAYDNLFQ